MQLSFEIMPGYGLDCFSHPNPFQFCIGMPLQQVIGIIQQQSFCMRKIDFLHSEKTPLLSDIVLILNDEGIKLVFDSELQRLKLIEIFDLSLVQLTYWNQIFNSESSTTRLGPSKFQINQVFGCTQSPELDTANRTALIHYRGLTFYLEESEDDNEFPVSPDYDQQHHHDDDSSENAELLTKSIFIYQGASHLQPTLSPLILAEFMLGNVYLKHLEVVRKDFLTQHIRLDIYFASLHANSATQQPVLIEKSVRLAFGDSVQKVMSLIGAPSKVFYKTEDKMKIHNWRREEMAAPSNSTEDMRDVSAAAASSSSSASAGGAISSSSTSIINNNTAGATSGRSNSSNFSSSNSSRDRRYDYFFNYFTLGLDVMFNQEDHCVRKFLLHTNFPNEYTFDSYYRCDFSIGMEKTLGAEPDNLTAFYLPDNMMQQPPPPPPPSHALHTNHVNLEQARQNSVKERGRREDVTSSLQPQLTAQPPPPQTLTVKTFTQWPEIYRNLSDRCDSKPVEIYRTCDVLKKFSNLGPTYAYGIDDIIFEVIPSNNHLASVTLYKSEITSSKN